MPSPSTTAQCAALCLLEHAHDFLLTLGQLTTDDTSMFARLTRAILEPPQPDAVPASPPPEPNSTYYWSLDCCVSMLGYVLSHKQAEAFLPKLEARCAAEYCRRHGTLHPSLGYPSADLPWIDAIIQSYLSHFPGLARVSVSAEQGATP